MLRSGGGAFNEPTPAAIGWESLDVALALKIGFLGECCRALTHSDREPIANNGCLDVYTR